LPRGPLSKVYDSNFAKLSKQ